MMVNVFCSAVNEFIRRRASCCSAARVSRPLKGPVRTIAGLLPKNDGVTLNCFPSTSVMFTDKWCPSTLQPQVWSVEGVP